MKTTELRIGDWVHIEGRGDFQVEALDNDGTILVDGDYYCTEDDCSPVSLTAAILEKNGFEKCGNHSWHDEILRQIYVRIVCLPEKDRDIRSSVWHFDFPCVVSAGADDVSFRCDYVHELQHVLKFCKVEKEIVL